MFSPVREQDGIWRMRFELYKPVQDADIIKFIKSPKIRWLGHMYRMDKNRNIKAITEWKPQKLGQEKRMDRVCGGRSENNEDAKKLEGKRRG